MVQISDFPVYEGPIPIDEVRSTHRRILDKAETMRGRTVRTENAAAVGKFVSVVVKPPATPYEWLPEPPPASYEWLPEPPPQQTEAEGIAEFEEAEELAEFEEVEELAEAEKAAEPGEAVEELAEAEKAEEVGEAEAAAEPGEAVEELAEAEKAEEVGEAEAAAEPGEAVEELAEAGEAAELGEAEVVEETEEAEEAKDTRPETPETNKTKAGETPTSPIQQAVRVKMPIAVKLVGIVTILLVLSLGAITVLSSILVSADVQLTAEDNNFSVNKRIAEAVETGLRGIRAAVTVFYYDLGAIRFNIQPDSTDAENAAADFFFEHNPQIAAIGIDGSSYFTNEAFFRDKGGDVNMPRSWAASEGADFESAAPDEILLRNASPFFGFPMLVMRLPLSGSVSEIFFTSEILNTLLGEGDNVSFLLNEAGEVLLHSDLNILLSGANYRQIPFVKNILDNSSSNMQTIYTDENGDEYFGAVQHLNIGSAKLITIIRTSVVFGGIMETTVRNIVLSVIVLIVSIIAIILFSRTISKPLRTLTSAAAKIEKGDYDLRLSVKSNDELGLLTDNFIGMGNSLENFEKFTNKTIVRLAKQGRLARTGENKKTTVCFALIRDFNKVSDGLDAGSVVDFVNGYLRLMVPCITMNGGSVDKFLTQDGVVIMALWGTPETAGSAEEDALNCIRASLSMRAALRCFNKMRRQKFGSHIPLVKLGCGINTGEVVAGQMGSDERMEYTVIGDAVNLASRIEGPNDLFDTDILISEETYNSVGGHLLTKEMRSISVKGKEKPLRIFAVVNMRSVALAKSMLEDLKKIDGLDIDICKKSIGREGPRSMNEVRRSWQV